MKKWLAAALCTAVAMSASSALAANINFVTAGTSSTFYPISATVCQLWNDSIEGMRATATPSGGGIDNLNQALDGEAQIGIDLTGCKRFVKITGTVSFTGGTTPAATATYALALGDPAQEPVE